MTDSTHKAKRKNLIVNMASESDISVQGHGVHTAYVELADALEKRSDITLVRGGYGKKVQCDVYHLHTLGYRMWKKIFDKNPKKVISAHVIPDSFVGSIALAKYWRFIAVPYMKWFYNRADKILAVSKTVANVLEDELGVTSDKIEVFYNTIDMQRYRTTDNDRKIARKAINIETDSKVVVGVGQLQPRKRIDVFAKMARDNPSINFIWVGGIPFKRLGAGYNEMQQLIEESPDNLHVTDVVPHEKVKQYLQAADVFCLPAEQENHPMCVLEAAGAGLPIVLRDIPEYDDTFKGDAILCNDDNFSEEIIKLVNNKSYYSHWKMKSRNISERFDSKNAAKRLVDIYKELCYNK